MAKANQRSWGQRLYGVFIAFFFIAITGASVGVSYQLFTNYFPTTDDGILGIGDEQARTPEVYILRSEHTIRTLRDFGMSEARYLERLDKAKQTLIALGATPEVISEEQLRDLPQQAALFAFDAIGLSDQSVANIQRFMARGGFLMFNYHFAYHGGERYRDHHVITDITTLAPPSDLTHVTPDGPIYLTPKLLSPISQRVYPRGYKLDLELYDPVPVFTSSSLEPSGLLTNWTVTTGLKVATELGQRQLQPSEAGGLWYGRFGKGNWVYTNLPSYSLLSSNDAQTQLDQLLNGILDYATQPLVVANYPYKDADKVTFVSQDTEYRYESFSRFIAAANQYQMPVTAFLVADLSEQNPHLVNEAERSPYIELGSHSYTHKKIVGTSDDNIRKETAGAKDLINSLTADKQVLGFRPPREELNDRMLQDLSNSGHQYVFEKRKDFQYPTIENSVHGLYTIPRNATDDYQYLVMLDWGPDKILERMKAETQLITMLNGVYGLSVHTHLMSYKGNIAVIENYFDYVNSRPDLTPLSGGDIIERVKDLSAIRYQISKTSQNYIVKVINNSERQIRNLNFRAYWPQGAELKDISSEIMHFTPGVKHNPLRGYSDISLSKISPRSTLTMILAYQ